MNLKHPKTFNEKIQWIKLYGVTPLMRDCTDKVKVRDYVKEKIGEEYLKPVLQIIPNESHETVRCHCKQVNDNLGLAWQSTDRCNHIPDCHDTQNEVLSRLRFPKFQFRENRVLAEYNDGEPNDVSDYFNQIDFDKLPNSFVIKTNHGCKWQYIIKNKNEFLKNKQLYETVKKDITGWLEQEYWIWGGFELQYKGIIPKILIEPLLRDEINTPCDEIHVYCFRGYCPVVIKFTYKNETTISIWDEKFNILKNIFNASEKIISVKADDNIKTALEISKILSDKFNFVRADWMLYQNKLYFEELTFTPYSGFRKFKNKKQFKNIMFI